MEIVSASQAKLDQRPVVDAQSQTNYQKGFAKANKTDCSLIGKFAFAAGEAYARGASKREFSTMAWAGFVAGHKEVLENQKSSGDLMEIFGIVYDQAAHFEAAFHINGSLSGEAAPSESVRRTISHAALFQLGSCVARDNRNSETKSESCVDSTLKDVGNGKIPFNKTYKALGLCHNEN